MKNYNKVKFTIDAIDPPPAGDVSGVIDQGDDQIEAIMLEDFGGHVLSAVRRKKYLNFETWKEIQKGKRLLEKKHRILITSTNERPTAGESHVPGIYNEEVPIKIEDRWGENEENFAGLKEPMPFIDPSSIAVAE